MFCELSLKPWDYAAGSLIVQEAGGCVVTPFEQEMDYDRTAAILAAAPGCLDKALEVVVRHRPADEP